MLDEDILKLRDHLRCKLFLLQVISTLYDAANKAEVLLVFKATIFIILSDLHANVVEGFLTEETLRFFDCLNIC